LDNSTKVEIKIATPAKELEKKKKDAKISAAKAAKGAVVSK